MSLDDTKDMYTLPVVNNRLTNSNSNTSNTQKTTTKMIKSQYITS